jgi:hypothetical protein
VWGFGCKRRTKKGLLKAEKELERREREASHREREWKSTTKERGPKGNPHFAGTMGLAVCSLGGARGFW